jgi:hypothetical protein
MEDATSIVQTSDNGYLIAGLTASFGAKGTDFYVVRTDSGGNMLWNKTYGGSRDDVASSVVPTADGGYLIAGATSSIHHSSEIWLVKVDANGNREWSRSYGGEETDTPISMIPTREGGYALAGRTRSFGAGEEDMWLVKTDSQGVVVWNQTFGGVSDEQARCIVQAEDGSYLVAGWTESFGAGLRDAYVVRFFGPAPPFPQSALIILLLTAGAVVALVAFLRYRKRGMQQGEPTVSPS